jgi:uncharacterized protein
MITPVLERPRAKGEAARIRAARTGIVDCDVHPTVNRPEELRPYLSDRWWRHYQTYGLRPRHGFAQADPYPKAQPRAARRDAWSPDGAKPGSDVEFVRKQYLDGYGVDHAILSPLNPSGQGERNDAFSAAMTSAVNDWQLDRWVAADPRFKASIVVPYEDGLAAREEIERRVGQPGFAQVLLLSRTCEPLGRRRYWPIYEAASRHGIPVAIHVFGYSGHAVSPSGWPSFYIEEMTGHSNSCQTLLASLVLEGVFEQFPNLKVVLIEGGFGWLPALSWRLDKHWERLRDEVPELSRPPSDYIREHIWITTQPMEEPEDREYLLDVMSWVGHERILFATDYPHWDFDDPAHALPGGLDPLQREAISSGNAKALFGLE